MLQKPLPEFTLPAPLARLVGRLPQRPPTLALVAALNLALGRILPRDTLAPLEGRTLRVCLRDAGLSLPFTLGPRGFQALPDNSSADLRITLGLRDALALMLRQEDPDTLFFSRRLLMEGDTELGLLVKNTLDGVDWEQLQQLLPPLPPFPTRLFGAR